MFKMNVSSSRKQCGGPEEVAEIVVIRDFDEVLNLRSRRRRHVIGRLFLVATTDEKDAGCGAKNWEGFGEKLHNIPHE